MRRTLRLCCGLAAVALLVGSHAASAATIAAYTFEEFTATNAAWPSNNGPYANTATEPGATASTLTSVGLDSLEALAVRDASHGDLDSHALLVGAGSMTANLSDAGNYLGFTVNADSTLLLNTFSFELGASNVDNNATLGHEVEAQLYYSIDGGTSFVGIGDVQMRATPPGPDDVFTGMVGSTIDLSSLSPVAAGEAIEFRLALANNRGYGTTSGAVYVDNLILDGTAVPEPSTIALVALAAAGFVAVRRR